VWLLGKTLFCVSSRDFSSKCKSRLSRSSDYVLDPSRFLGVDAYWALCMAFNVYLAFFREYTIHQLKAFDLIYLSLCYGLAFIPAFLFVLLSNASRGRVYGPAIVSSYIPHGIPFRTKIGFRSGVGSVSIGVSCGSRLCMGSFGKSPMYLAQSLVSDRF
jgi:hypothetical protein